MAKLMNILKANMADSWCRRILSNLIKQTFGLTGLISRQLDSADYGIVKEEGESVSFHQIPCQVPLKSKAPIHDSLN